MISFNDDILFAIGSISKSENENYIYRFDFENLKYNTIHLTMPLGDEISKYISYSIIAKVSLESVEGIYVSSSNTNLRSFINGLGISTCISNSFNWSNDRNFETSSHIYSDLSGEEIVLIRETENFAESIMTIKEIYLD